MKAAVCMLCCIVLLWPTIIHTLMDAVYQNNENINSPFTYTPEKGWINDPNGLVFVDGIYHLFYQYNPTSNHPLNISWGHATSSDLVSWHDNGVAIHYAPRTTEEIFSGSAVFDHTNSSGLCDSTPPTVALYTSHYQSSAKLSDGSEVAANTQAQSLAYSCDSGNTWSKYPENPVIPSPPKQYASQYWSFRDPNIIKNQTHNTWSVTTVLSNLGIAIWFSSHNLINWTFTGEFSTTNAPNGEWECPALMEFTVRNTGEKKWVLIVSTNPGGLWYGSSMYYHIGHFDGYAFKSDANETGIVRWFDYGTDCYAGILWNNLPYDKIIMSVWVDNWKYGPKIGDYYKGGISCRELNLVKVDGEYKLLQSPIHQLDKYVEKVNKYTKLQMEMGMKMFKNKAYRISIEMKGVNASDFTYIIEDEKKQLVTKIYFTHKDKTICIQRRDPDPDRNSTYENHCVELATLRNNWLQMEILIDNYTMTMYLEGGEWVFTEILPFYFERRKLRLVLGYYKIMVKAIQSILVLPKGKD